MEKKLEITKKLEEMAMTGELDRSIAILNLPSANYCDKRGERVNINGKLQQSCLGCITNEISAKSAINETKIKLIIDFFAKNYGTKFITINGRGDPLHSKTRSLNLWKIDYANKTYGMRAYIFTAGDNLDRETCEFLAKNQTNVMISLFGNKFIDADFFSGKEYPQSEKPLQNQARIAKNLRDLLKAYTNSSSQPIEGTTRIGMNYVVSEEDLKDRCLKLSKLKAAANNNNVFFVCNTPFLENTNVEIQKDFEKIANQYSDFNLRHSTAVNDKCQMGAGSAITVDYNGVLLRCPYQNNVLKGRGKFQEMKVNEIKEIASEFIADRAYPCVMRKHQK